MVLVLCMYGVCFVYVGCLFCVWRVLVLCMYGACFVYVGCLFCVCMVLATDLLFNVIIISFKQNWWIWNCTVRIKIQSTMSIVLQIQTTDSSLCTFYTMYRGYKRCSVNCSVRQLLCHSDAIQDSRHDSKLQFVLTNSVTFRQFLWVYIIVFLFFTLSA